MAAAAGQSPPALPADLATGKLAEVRAVFVTLTKSGNLPARLHRHHSSPRAAAPGGHPRCPQRQAVEDPRFPALRPAELKDITIEISVLTVPRRLECKSAGEVLREAASRHRRRGAERGWRRGHLSTPGLGATVRQGRFSRSSCPQGRAAVGRLEEPRDRLSGLPGRGVQRSSRRDAPVLYLAGVGCLGVSAVLAQLTLRCANCFRRSGNELVFGVVLGNWMLLTGIGSALGRRAADPEIPAGGPGRRPGAPGPVAHRRCRLAADLAQRGLCPRGRDRRDRYGGGAVFLLLAPYCLAVGYALTLASLILSPGKGRGGHRAHLFPRQRRHGGRRGAVHLRAGPLARSFRDPLPVGPAEPAAGRRGGQPLLRPGDLDRGIRFVTAAIVALAAGVNLDGRISPWSSPRMALVYRACSPTEGSS